MDGKTNLNLTTLNTNISEYEKNNDDAIKTEAMTYLVYKMGKLKIFIPEFMMIL